MRAAGGIVLLVDDLPEARHVLREALEHEGFLVETVDNGAQALAKAPTLIPDVIVMDLWMPVLDGWETTRRLKLDARTRHIPVIAMSGHAFRRSEIEARSVGCDLFLPKPCPPEDLLASIRALLDSTRLSVRGAGMDDDQLFELIDRCGTQQGALETLCAVERGLPRSIEPVDHLRRCLEEWSSA